MRVTVIGAGVAGLTTAICLAERGADVQVYERSPALGTESCSRYAGGMLAPWCERESAEALVSDLGRESLPFWQDHHAATVQRGSLVLAQRRDAPELERFARRTGHFERLDTEGLTALEPDLAGRFTEALFFPSEGHLDPRAAVASLSQRLAGLGVAIQFGADGYDQVAPGERIVDCRGLAARDALPGLRGVKGEMLLLRCPDMSLTRPVRLLHPRFPLYIVPRGEGLYMVGATSIESDDRRRVTARSVMELLNAAYALHPAFAEAEIVELGADARPAFADNLPRIVTRGCTTYVNGLYRHGFLLSPALARRAAAAVLDGAVFPEVMSRAMESAA